MGETAKGKQSGESERYADWYSGFILGVSLGLDEGMSAEEIWAAVSQLIPPPEAWGDDPRNQEAARQVSEVVSIVTTPAEDTLSLFRQYVDLAVQAAHERGQEESD